MAVRNAELFLRSGMVTRQQLEEAGKRQKTSKGTFGEALVESGALTERQLVDILERQLGLPAVRLYETTIDRDAAMAVNEAIARKHCLVPLARQGGKLKVAIADPLNY